MPFWPLSFSGALVLHNHCMSAPLLHADFYPHGAISVWHKRKGHQEMMLWQASSLMYIHSNRADTPAEGKSAASASSSLCTKCLFQDKKPSRFFIKQNTGMRTDPQKRFHEISLLSREVLNSTRLGSEDERGGAHQEVRGIFFPVLFPHKALSWLNLGTRERLESRKHTEMSHWNLTLIYTEISH